MSEISKYFVVILLLFSVLDSYGQCAPDVTPPTISCRANVSVPCPHKIGYDTGDTSINATTSDNCGVVLQTYILTGATTGSSASTGINDASFAAFLGGTTTVTYYIEDAAGNSASCSFNVTVTDNSPPIIYPCAPNIETFNDPDSCGAFVSADTLSYPTVYDSCFGISTVPTGIPTGYIFPVGSTDVTWTATDAAGNSSTCIQTVTVSDQEDPTIVCPADINVNTDVGLCTANVTIPLAVGSDNCTVSSVTNDYNGGGANASGIYPIGTTTVTFTVFDATNKMATCSMNVTVTNTQNPTITLLGANPLTLEACSPYIEPGATALDSCAGNITDDIVINASALITNEAGSYSVIYTVTNASGNSTQIIRTVNIVDTTNPTLALIGQNPLTINACSTYTELGAVANDPCFGDISTSVLANNASVNTSVLGTYIVTYIVTDASGNTAASITRTVNVEDLAAPDITLSGDNPQIIEACLPYEEMGATALDTCFNIDYSGCIVIDASGVDTSVPGIYTVIYTVTDSAGNTSLDIIRDVEVVDTTTPSISCPSEIIVDNDMGECSAEVNYTTPVGVDNCPVTIVQTEGLASGSAFPIGTTTNTFEVSDTQGNIVSCSFDVTVNDTEVPVAICQSYSIELDALTGMAIISPSDIDNGSTDNCNFTLSLSQTTFDCSEIGDHTITLTITDASGNIATCDAIVTVMDLAQDASVSISTPTNLICQNELITFTATPTNGGPTPSYQWQINGLDVTGETSDTFTTTNLNDSDEVSVNMTSSASICAFAVTSNSIVMTINDYNPPADAGSDISNTICTNTTISLAGSAIVGSGTTGLWTVTSEQTSGFSFSDASSPLSTFTGDIGETYILTWNIDNPDPCPDTSDSMTVTFIGCSALDFDGVDDNITFRNNYNFNGAFTIEVWMKSEVSNSNIQTIFSKREANNPIDGYDLSLVDNYISFNWNDGASLTSPFPIITNQWHHIAVIFNGSIYTLYIDGIEMNSIAGLAPITNAVDCILGAMDQTLTAPFKPLNYFNGGMDELRIWDVNLSSEQIRKMMNQEIQDDSGSVKGNFVPIDITDLAWSDLNGYYQMNQTNDILGGNLVSNNGNAIDGVLRYMTTLQPESAPIPYKTDANGVWTNNSTWLNGTVQAIPNSIGIDGSTRIDWNIVRTSHNISSGDNNITLLGLNVESNTLSIENSDPYDGQSLTITDYLILDGTLDLVGESQLLQKLNSIVDYDGTGNLQRDQQGTSNLFNYNYWSSPVSENGSNFTIGNILKDGSTYTNPQTINWVNSYDATGSINPITLSNRWIYTYEDTPGEDYYDWVFKGRNSPIDIGLGFTLKGSGVGDPVADFQNYVFVGKPNNGDISIPMIPTYQALIGNPYPSAIDADQFIRDNGPLGSNAIDGPLYFWEHATTNASHVLSEYEGGYATYCLSGGCAAIIVPSEIAGLGTSNKIPQQFIPIAQGFYVTSSADGGTVIFNNQQRKFEKEAAENSIFLRSTPENSNNAIDSPTNAIKRVRLNITSPDGAVRPLLLAFTPNNEASENVDYGYDALNTEDFPNDASFIIDGHKYVIQGMGNFESTLRYPLGLFLTTAGTIDIALSDLENFNQEIDVYVYDSLNGTSIRINDLNYSISLAAADYLDRFYIVFEPVTTLSNGTTDVDENIDVTYLTDSRELYIYGLERTDFKHIQLFNMLGQNVATFSPDDMISTGSAVRIPVKLFSEGTYIVKIVTTSSTTITKKFIFTF